MDDDFNEVLSSACLWFLIIWVLSGGLKTCDSHTKTKEEQPAPPKTVIEQSHVKPSYLKNFKLASNNRQRV